MKNKIEQLSTKYKEMKKTEKGKSIIKLIAYLAFILILIIAMIISGTGKTNNKAANSVKKESYESVKDITYKEKEERLYTNSYDFRYIISGAVNITYFGTYKDDVTTGYKEDNTGIIKYTIIDGNRYKIENGENVLYEGLYEGLDETLFNFESMFTTLNSNKAKIKSKDNIKEYFYENIDGYNYTITMDDTYINEIKIENNSLKYYFSFNY